MEILTMEQIAKMTDDLDGMANIKAINKIFREQDQSNLWPICGKYNVTERAIKKARKFMADSGAVYGLEYCYLLDGIISDLVNHSY